MNSDAAPNARRHLLSLFVVPERDVLSYLKYLRWALVIVFLWIGGMKFTAYEANAISGFVANSPLMSWLYTMAGVRGASDVIGVFELSTAIALAVGAFNGAFSALGAAMSCATYLITLSFFPTTPGVAVASAGGFPVISAAPGQFLLKDVVLLASSVVLLRASLAPKQSQNGIGRRP